MNKKKTDARVRLIQEKRMKARAGELFLLRLEDGKIFSWNHMLCQKVGYKEIDKEEYVKALEALNRTEEEEQPTPEKPKDSAEKAVKVVAKLSKSQLVKKYRVLTGESLNPDEHSLKELKAKVAEASHGDGDDGND